MYGSKRCLRCEDRAIPGNSKVVMEMSHRVFGCLN